jgi:hypothetical protein
MGCAAAHPYPCWLGGVAAAALTLRSGHRRKVLCVYSHACANKGFLRGQGGSPSSRLILQNLLDLADLLLHFARDLLSSPLGLQPAVAGHDSGRLFQFAFHFSRSALHSVFCAVFHDLCSSWQSNGASNALVFLTFTLLNRSSPPSTIRPDWSEARTDQIICLCSARSILSWIRGDAPCLRCFLF